MTPARPQPLPGAAPSPTLSHAIPATTPASAVPTLGQGLLSEAGQEQGLFCTSLPRRAQHPGASGEPREVTQFSALYKLSSDECSAEALAGKLPNLLRRELELCLDGDPKQGKIRI